MKASSKKGATLGRGSVSYTRLAVADALRTWVVPTVTITGAALVYIAHNLDLLSAQLAVSIVGSLALALALFWGIRDYFAEEASTSVRWLACGFAVLWCWGLWLPFYRSLNFGEPIFSSELRRGAPPVVAHVAGHGGRYDMIVESRFATAERGQNRSATYRITVGHDGHTDEIAEGTFHQDWHTQRVGAGRRSFAVPALSETTQVRNVIVDSDGHDLDLQLAELSGGGDHVTVRLYPEHYPAWLFTALGVVTVALAFMLDGYRPKSAATGLLTTLAIGSLVAVATIRASAGAQVHFAQLVIALLVGAVTGPVGGGLLWRLGRPLRRYLPAAG
jgi:hypothetical protein